MDGWIWISLDDFRLDLTQRFALTNWKQGTKQLHVRLLNITQNHNHVRLLNITQIINLKTNL